VALEAAKAYIRLKPNEVPLVIILIAGAASQGLEKHDHALYYFKKVLETEPGHAYAMVLASRSLFTTGQVEPAFNLVRKAIETAPGFSGAPLTMMRMQETLGDLASAFITVLTALGKNPHDPQLIAHFDRLALLTD
jgi:tetratricopeptide (TPR) repeat protein